MNMNLKMKMNVNLKMKMSILLHENKYYVTKKLLSS